MRGQAKIKVRGRTGSSHEGALLCLLGSLTKLDQGWQMMEYSGSVLVKYHFCNRVVTEVWKGEQALELYGQDLGYTWSMTQTLVVTVQWY